MASKTTPKQDSVPVRVGGSLSDAFKQLQERIRERAYHIFANREGDAGDPVADWLDAQAQLVTPVELVVKEQKKNILVEGKLKGFSPKEIEIDVGGDELRVFGSHTESKSSGKAGATETRSESSHFYQAIVLPCAVDPDRCKAKLFKNGKLSITLPKKNGDK